MSQSTGALARNGLRNYSEESDSSGAASPPSGAASAASPSGASSPSPTTSVSVSISSSASTSSRGAVKAPLDHVVVLHDEIDLPFGDVRTRVGGGLAGHNGLKSLRRELGSPDFARVRVGVGRPDSSDPEVVSAYVLGKWRQPREEVAALVERAREAAERVVFDA